MHSSWLCVDANLVIRLIADPGDELVRQLWEQWDDAGRQLAAPTLLHYEVTNALYRHQKLGLMSVSSARLALKAALGLPIHLYGEADLYERSLSLAERFSLTASWRVSCSHPCRGCIWRDEFGGAEGGRATAGSSASRWR